MPRASKISLCEQYLFDNKDELIKNNLAPSDIEAILRIRMGYTYWRDFPNKKEKEIRDIIVAEYGVEKSTAYEDIKIIKTLIGNFEKASKDWHRWRFIQRNEDTREFARKKGQAMAMAKTDADYAKYVGLGIEDVEPVDWEKILVQPFFPTSDPTVIGLKPIPNINEKIANLKKKYLEDIEAVDVDYVDVTNNQEDIFKTDKEREDEHWS